MQNSLYTSNWNIDIYKWQIDECYACSFKRGIRGKVRWGGNMEGYFKNTICYNNYRMDTSIRRPLFFTTDFGKIPFLPLNWPWNAFRWMFTFCSRSWTVSAVLFMSTTTRGSAPQGKAKTHRHFNDLYGKVRFGNDIISLLAGAPRCGDCFQIFPSLLKKMENIRLARPLTQKHHISLLLDSSLMTLLRWSPLT